MKPGFIQKQKIKLAKRIIHRLMPPPVVAEHWEYTCLFSAKDDNAFVSSKLLDIAIDAIKTAREIDLTDIAARFENTPINPDPRIWPGDHYRLLAALVINLKPKIVIEIGTSFGTSALSMLKFLPKDGKIYTFDIVPWEEIGKVLFKPSDFESNQLVQYLDDLSIWDNYLKHIEIFENADLIFVDAKKDGKMEKEFIDSFNKTKFVNKPIIVFDDIKNWAMLKIWREITHSKLDITSFGHFTGTGIVEWENK